MALYIGANYHPHDWDSSRWRTDVKLMKEAGFTTVRLGHLCWDSYEPEEGVYTFSWFDEVMDLFAEAGIGVVLDVSMRPAPTWVHKLCPGCNIVGKEGNMQPSIRRYMEDVADPAYQKYALRFAEILVKRYRNHPALFAFGLCNELGSGQRSYSEYNRQRFVQWLKHKYGTVEQLNRAWATRRWSRRLTSFDDECVMQYGSRQYHQTGRQNRVEVQKVFYDLNRDFNTISLTNRKHAYKLLILPDYVMISEKEAEEIRRFVAEGGCVIMTAYSATVDEHSQVFGTPRPGRLDDVFGIRVSGFDRTGAEWRDFDGDAKIVEDEKGKRELLKVKAEEEFYIDVEYYEELELHTAKAYAAFPDKGLCAVSENSYGKGKAYYIAAETNAVILKWLIRKLTPVLGLNEGMKVPEGIQARKIAEGQKFYVNTTNRRISVSIEKPGRGVISEKEYEDELILEPYDAELLIERK